MSCLSLHRPPGAFTEVVTSASIDKLLNQPIDVFLPLRLLLEVTPDSFLLPLRASCVRK